MFWNHIGDHFLLHFEQRIILGNNYQSEGTNNRLNRVYCGIQRIQMPANQRVHRGKVKSQNVWDTNLAMGQQTPHYVRVGDHDSQKKGPNKFDSHNRATLQDFFLKFVAPTD